MSIGKFLRLTLLSITLTMVVGYTWLMEENLASGLLLGSEIRLNRTADAWIESKADLSSLEPSRQESQSNEILMPPVDGTPIVYAHKDSLPVAVQEQLPEAFFDGQFTIIKFDEVGFLNMGYLLHLFRTLPSGDGLHVVQQLVLADYENARVQKFDSLMYKRALLPGGFFVLTSILIVFLFGRRVTKATTQLLRWSESLSIQSLPEEPPKLPFLEMQRIAAGTLATVQRERDAIEHRHRFLRFASHELRTPLAIASANTELLARYGVDVNGMNALARLEESLKNMKSLTETLLWLGRGETPLPDSEPVDLLCLVNKIIEENSTLATTHNLKVEVVGTLSKPIVQPRVLLVILCSNLISNAIRYTRDGRVEIRISDETIEIENRGNQLGDEVGGSGHGLGLQLVAWVVERADWQWDEDGDEMFRRHRIHLTSTQN
jgi:signal transduction histidine kinase